MNIFPKRGVIGGALTKAGLTARDLAAVGAR